MTAESFIVPVVSALAGYIGWFAVPLLGFSILGMIGRR